MNKLVLLTSAVAIALTSGIAGAVTLKNTGKDTVVVSMDSGGKKSLVKIKTNATYDTKGKDASFAIGKATPVSGKGAEKLVIKGGKIEVEKSDVSAVATKDKTVKTETPAPTTDTAAK